LCVLDDFADKHAAESNLNLVNKESLDKILRVEVFVHDDSQLRVAHLILGYKPISSGFQAPKCVIRAKNPRLHRISIVVPSFLLLEGAPIPENTFSTQPIPKGDLLTQSIPKGIPKLAFPSQHTTGESISSQPTNKEEGVGEEEEEENEVVDVSDSDDIYEVFNQPPSPVTTTSDLDQFSQLQSSDIEGAVTLSNEMGIQWKQRSNLQELLESQLGRDAPEKSA